MMRAWLADQGLLLAPAFALALFLTIFVGVLVWIFRPGSRQVYDREALLPFEEGSPAGGMRASTSLED